MEKNEEEFVPNPSEAERSSGLLEKLKTWSVLRWLQLGVGGLFVGEFLSSGEWPVLLIGGVLMGQGLFARQMGCGCAGACEAKPKDQ